MKNSAKTCRASRVSETETRDLRSSERTLRVSKITARTLMNLEKNTRKNSERNTEKNLKKNSERKLRRKSKKNSKKCLLVSLD